MDEKELLYLYACKHSEMHKNIIYQNFGMEKSSWICKKHNNIQNYELDDITDLRDAIKRNVGISYSIELEKIILVSAMKNRIDKEKILHKEKTNKKEQDNRIPDYIYVF